MVFWWFEEITMYNFCITNFNVSLYTCVTGDMYRTGTNGCVLRIYYSHFPHMEKAINLHQ